MAWPLEATVTLTHDHYTVAWLCALPIEKAAARNMLDELHLTPPQPEHDKNIYTFGRIRRHNVVIVCQGDMGTTAASIVATQMDSTFRRLRFRLLVGIAGGVPEEKDIRLGDVVISQGDGRSGGIVAHDRGKVTLLGFESRPFLNDVPEVLRNAFRELESRLIDQENKITMYLSEATMRNPRFSAFEIPTCLADDLFQSDYPHVNPKDKTCADCSKAHTVSRSPRADPLVHFGIVASGNQVIKNAAERARIHKAHPGVLAIEMEAAGLMNFFGCATIRGICDYADSHKNDGWHKYASATAAAVAKEVLGIIPVGRGVSAPSIAVVEKDSARRAKEIEILKSLGTFPYQERKDRNPDRIRGTCEWFVAHELFRDWRESKSSRMLWVSADPGCGKSVLAKYLVDSVLATSESRATCYFFFKDDFEDQKSIVSALRCILQQLFLQKRVLLSETILERFEIKGENFTSSFGELWDALTSAAEDKNAGEIVCLLDAIDECEDCGRSQLTQALCKLYGTKRNFNLKFLLTSRPYGGIRRSFQPLEIPEMPVIHLSGESDVEMEKISAEIDIFIKARVQSIKAQLKLRHDEEELLLRELMHVRNRTYLWVHLTLNLIESDIDINKTGIANVTSSLPKSVDEAYERILSKSSNSEEAKRLLQIIVAAARPLTLKEMSLALALRENHQSYSDLDLKSEERFRENIRDLCGLFVTVRDTRIYLLHQTAKEILVQNHLANHSKSVQRDLKWKNSLTPQESHRILLEICIWHLLFIEFEEHPFNVNEALSRYVDSHVFLDYSAKNWTVHFHESHVKVDGVVQSLLRICDAGSSRCQTWFRIYWMSTHADFPENFTNLMIASYFGLGEVVKLLLRMNGVDLNSKDGTNGRSALSWAAGNGFNVIVKLLIKGTWSYLPFRNGAEVDSVDRYGRTPLSYAAWNGHVDIVRLLLKAGAWVHSGDEIGGRPLFYAICNEHEAVVKLLLKSETPVDLKDMIRETLLLSAIEKGHVAVVRMLLEKGIELEIKSDYYGRLPLSLAAEKGHKTIVRLLLENGAELDTKFNGQTPLSWAAKKGHEAVMRLLLEKGAELETKSSIGKTPLSLAAERGHEAAVRLLLEKGAELETKTTYSCRTPLSWASYNGHEAVVRLLLEEGAELETKSSYGRTPLSYAAENGHEGVVRLLLEKGAELKTRDKNDWTPLSWARDNRHEVIVSLLLERSSKKLQ